MTASAHLSPRALRPSPRIGAAVSPDLGARMPLDLTRAARAVTIAASDARAEAARTDHLVHVAREYVGKDMCGLAEAVRDHAEGVSEAAAWVARCAVIPALPELVAAIESGADVWVDGTPLSARAVVVRPDADRAGLLPTLRAWARRGRDLLSRRAA